MNLFICKCKDDDKDEKSAMDLLDIKNLENSIKKEEMKIKFSKYNFLEKLKDNKMNNLEDELEIIDYPYQNIQDKIAMNNCNHLIKLKQGIVNKNNKIFCSKNENNIQELKKKSNNNNSSLNSESLIEDNIEYLNDEDSLKVLKNNNKIKLNQIKNPKGNTNNIKIKYLNKSPNNKYSLNNNIINYNITNKPTKSSKNKIFRNESLKSGTTEVSTLKRNKKSKRKELSEKKDLYLKNQLNKRIIDNYKDYKEFKNDLNKTFEEFSKSIYSPEKIKQIYNNNDIKFINEISPNKMKTKQIKDNLSKNIFENKRINRKRIKFKKLFLK